MLKSVEEAVVADKGGVRLRGFDMTLLESYAQIVYYCGDGGEASTTPEA